MTDRRSLDTLRISGVTTRGFWAAGNGLCACLNRDGAGVGVKVGVRNAWVLRLERLEPSDGVVETRVGAVGELFLEANRALAAADVEQMESGQGGQVCQWRETNPHSR